MTFRTPRPVSADKKTLSASEARGWEELMIIAAFRYCCGRQSYMVGVAAEWIIKSWQLFPPRLRTLIQRDLEDMFDRDDRDRASGDSHKALGADFDRQAWEQVRTLWKTESALPPEKSIEWHQQQVALLDLRAAALRQEMLQIEQRHAGATTALTVRKRQIQTAVSQGLASFDETIFPASP